MKKITYLELLEMIKERKQPRRVVCDDIFGWYREEFIQCKECKYLNVINSNAVYARCEKHGIEFLPFEDDTRECFCSWAERVEE